MTEIEQKALALVNEVRAERNQDLWRDVGDRKGYGMVLEALCRAIEQHEKFKWEVSYAALSALKVVMEMAEHDCEVMVRPILERFIIAKPDPLVEALEEASGTNDPVEWANRFYAAIEKRGGKLTWGEG